MAAILKAGAVLYGDSSGLSPLAEVILMRAFEITDPEMPKPEGRERRTGAFPRTQQRVRGPTPRGSAAFPHRSRELAGKVAAGTSPAVGPRRLGHASVCVSARTRLAAHGAGVGGPGADAAGGRP